MEELTKANHNIQKLGGAAITQEATMAEMQQRLECFKESTEKASKKIVDLQNKEVGHLKRISHLEREVLKLTGDLELAKGDVSSSKMKLEEVEAKTK